MNLCSLLYQSQRNIRTNDYFYLLFTRRTLRDLMESLFCRRYFFLASEFDARLKLIDNHYFFDELIWIVQPKLKSEDQISGLDI